MYNLGDLPYVPEGLNFGLMVHDVGGSQVRHETGFKETILRENIRWGFSYRPFSEWPWGKIPINDPLIALDFDNRWHLGLEFWLSRALAVRGGLQKDFHTKERAILSFGMGLHIDTRDFSKLSTQNQSELLIDFPLSDNNPTGSIKDFSGSIIRKNDPRLITIESVFINELFASLYPAYARDKRIGIARIKNNSGDSISVAVNYVGGRLFNELQEEQLLIAPI